MKGLGGKNKVELATFLVCCLAKGESVEGACQEGGESVEGAWQERQEAKVFPNKFFLMIDTPERKSI